MSERKEIAGRIESIEGLVHEIEKLSDPAVRSLAKQLIQSLMDLHGSGLEAMLEIIHRTGDVGQNIIDEMAFNELVRSLLLLYGLHPLGLKERVVAALEKTRPYLRSHGGNVQLVRCERRRRWSRCGSREAATAVRLRRSRCSRQSSRRSTTLRRMSPQIIVEGSRSGTKCAQYVRSAGEPARKWLGPSIPSADTRPIGRK